MGLEDMILDKIDLNGNKIPDRKELAPVIGKLGKAAELVSQAGDLEILSPALAGIGENVVVLEARLLANVAAAQADKAITWSDVERLVHDEAVQQAIIGVIMHGAALRKGVNAEKLSEAVAVMSDIKKDVDAFVEAGKKKKK